MKTTTTIGCGLAVGLVAASCGTSYRTLRADHCANQDGNDWCRTQYEDGSRPYCSRGISGCEAEMAMNSTAQDGCIAMRPVDDACYSPCGQRMSFGEDASCLDGESSSSGTAETSDTTAGSSGSESGSESSTTGPMPCMVDEDCTEDAAPFCEPVSGECVSCDGTADPDGACAGVDPMAPLCVGGACVQCTAAAPQACTGATPICDDAANTCVPCTAHEQCGEAACNLFTGACLPADAVVHVGPGQPFAELAAAVGSFAGGAEGTIVVHQDNYDEAVTVDGDRTLAFLAAEGDLPLWAFLAGGTSQLTVSPGSTVLVDGMQLSSNANDVGLHVDGGLAWVDRSRIVQNSGGGVLAENGAELTLRNCFVGRNGDDFADTRGISATGSSVDVVYTTIAANDGTAATGPISISCDAATTGEVRNSIVAAGDDTIACANVSFSFSVVDTAGLAGSDNEVLSFNPAWFPGIAMSDFHVSAGPPFVDVAQWSTGDPLTDIDAEPRPNVDGTPDYAGADVP
jgi:hypothetical protein